MWTNCKGSLPESWTRHLSSFQHQVCVHIGHEFSHVVWCRRTAFSQCTCSRQRLSRPIFAKMDEGETRDNGFLCPVMSEEIAHNWRLCNGRESRSGFILPEFCNVGRAFMRNLRSELNMGDLSTNWGSNTTKFMSELQIVQMANFEFTVSNLALSSRYEGSDEDLSDPSESCKYKIVACV